MDPLTLQSVRSPCPQGPPNRLTGLRWGELIALKPRHLDLIERTLKVEETVVEMSIRELPHRRSGAHQALPQGQRGSP